MAICMYVFLQLGLDYLGTFSGNLRGPFWGCSGLFKGVCWEVFSEKNGIDKTNRVNSRGKNDQIKSY